MRNTCPLVNKCLYTIKGNYEKHIVRYHKSMLNTMKKHFDYSSDSLLETWVNAGISYLLQWDYEQNMRYPSEADTHSGGHPDVFFIVFAFCFFCQQIIRMTNVWK